MIELVLGRLISCLDWFWLSFIFPGCFGLFEAVEVLRWFSVAPVCCFFFCIA